MATTFEREIRPVDITQLKNELNGSVDITATVINIDLDTVSVTGNNINITWNTDLLVDEITAQDVVVAAHTVQIPDVSLIDLPISTLGKQLAVHQSTKPAVDGKEFFLQWTGAGDDVANGLIGGGDLLVFDIKDTDTTVTKEIRFDPQFGDVYIHEGYAKWSHADPMANGTGDYMSAMIMAEPTPLQTAANLDYIVADNWITYAGPGAGTHGFAGQPVLIPRPFSKDGDWDYDGVNLTPNMGGTGPYKMSSVMRTVHRYMNKIPMCFTSGSYNRLTSDETAYLPPGYFIRVTAFNTSSSNWNCAFMFEVYRERTAVP